jgi:hypothetical protein
LIRAIADGDKRAMRTLYMRHGVRVVNTRSARYLGRHKLAHLTGIAFAYDPVIPAASGWASMPSEWIEGQRAQSVDAAKTALRRRGRTVSLTP